MKYTVLDMTQEILSSMDSDEVNSISDTTEALQVARVIRQAYYDLIEDLNPPEHYSTFELTPSGDSSKPTLLSVPTDVSTVIWIKYNKIEEDGTDPDFDDMSYLPLAEFLNRMYQLRPSEANVGSYLVPNGTDNLEIFYVDDHAPTYYTTLGDDHTIVFDSYDAAVDTTIQKSKTICYGKKIVTFQLEDGFIPDLDDQSFSRLLNEAKVLAFSELKTVEHPVANRNAQRARTRSYVRKFKVKGLSDFEKLPNYGRV